jgi:V/A-type H+-transporting ATPase subunit K
MSKKRTKKLFWIFFLTNLLIPDVSSAAATTTTTGAIGLGYLAAGLAVGLASIGAGIGVGIAGAAAIGSISEKPEILGRTLIFIGLAEGVAIYGLIIAIMILGRI